MSQQLQHCLGHGAPSMPTIDKSHVWESLAVEIDPADFLESIILAEQSEDKERIESLLCGAVKMLRNNRVKPDQVRK
jgi:hypothetical protein